MNELHIDKTHWKRTKIGDLLYKTEYNDKENASKQYSKFIKMEHLDANSLNIHRWGDSSVEDIPPTFYKIFKKGQILYPTRNPQLRRAALASFDGICGEKTLTLSLIEGCEGYIPFIAHVFHSSKFIEYATNARIGSTNPHIRWRDVADYEFLLPPKAEQKRLAELLWAADEVVEKEKKTYEKLKVIEYNLITKLNNPYNNATRCQLGEIVTLNYGKALKEADRIDGRFPVLSSSGITGTHANYMVKGPGIVVGRKGSAGNVIWVDKDFWTIDTAYWVSLKKNDIDIDIKWVYLLLQALNLTDLAITTAIPGLNRDDAYEQIVYIPSIEEQKKIVTEYDKIKTTIDKSSMMIGQSQQIKQELINKVF